ncbi:MAG: serine/threonine protein kinase [Lachnospiraceae bacterium]|nr:serine/threonine protein kinase [Lachnospiraceae bacterium]
MDLNTLYPMALPIGCVLAGQYVIEGILGQGGFGITYAARDHVSKNVVAIKEYFPNSIATRINYSTVIPLSANKKDNYDYGLDCFKKEAYTLGQFAGHPNIVNIHCYFEENSTAYFVMDMIRGMSLASYLKQKKVLPYDEALRILLPVMNALVDVHNKGIIHRDISPDNIYLEDGGGIKLLDFGAARYSIGDRTQSLSIILKHGFAPPEQYQSRGHQGPFTDIYALAATFYNVLSGKKLPDSIERMTDDHMLSLTARGVSLPMEADQAIMRALSVDRNMRFQRMQDFISALNINREAAGPKAAMASAFAQPRPVSPAPVSPVPVSPAPVLSASTGNPCLIPMIIVSLLFAGLFVYAMYEDPGIKSRSLPPILLGLILIYIIIMTCIILSNSPYNRFKKGMKSLHSWQFSNAEKYLYPLLTRKEFDPLMIYETLYHEALISGQRSRAERYLSEVRSTYGGEAAERVKNR